jgi:two-component system, OmpR family, sensor kinase
VKLSLRWRIAGTYALLLILALVAASTVILWRFQAILYYEAHIRALAAMNEIIADTANQPLLQALTTNNLEAWQSPTTYVQVDTIQGYPIARSPNLGATSIPPNTGISDAHAHALREATVDGRSLLIEDRLVKSGAFEAVIHVGESLDEVHRTFRETLLAIVVILAVAAVLVVLCAMLLTAPAIGPITRLSRAMREIGSERLDERLPGANRKDEIGDLTRSFNDLLARLQEAFARERQFISDASHELKTPLTSINANAQLLLRWGDRDEAIRRESIETIQHESATLAEMVNGMLMLAKADRGDAIPKEPVSLAMVAQEAVRGAAPRAAEKELRLLCEAPTPSPLVEGDPQLLRQLASNLIDNALKFTSEGGVTVRVGGDTSWAWIEVADTGPGIPEAELDHIFDRFYRADKARSRDVPGTGLGLAIVRSIARVHGGMVGVRNGPNGGAIFTATFPRIQETLTSPS